MADDLVRGVKSVNILMVMFAIGRGQMSCVGVISYEVMR